MKKSKFLILGALASLSLFSLTGCGNKVEPASKDTTTIMAVNDLNSIENKEETNLTNASMSQKKLISSNKSIMGLKFEDFTVSTTTDGNYVYSTDVTNTDKDTVILTSDNIIVNDGDKVLKNLFNEIKIFEDECITVSFETEASQNPTNLTLTITNSYKSITFK